MQVREGSRPKGRRWPLIAACAAVAALAAAACGTPGSSQSSESSSAAAATSVSSAPVTIKTLDALHDPGPDATQKKLVAMFEQLHPNITINRTSMQFNDFINTVKLRLSSSDAPDVSEGNQGPQIDGALIKGGLIKPLTPYVTKFGWDKLWTPTTLLPNTWDSAGTQFGSGEVLYGVSSRAEIVGVYYNKKTLAKIGQQVPTTFAEFESVLAAAKAAGIQPLMAGGLDKYPLGHMWMELADHYNDAKTIQDWVFGKAGANIDTPGSQQAAAKLQEWAKYMEKDFNSVSDTDAQARFAKGEGLFSISGPWQNGGYAAKLGNDVGFFLLPPDNAGDPVKATGAVSLPNHLSSKTQHEAEGAEWLNFLESEDAAKVIAQGGDLPARPLDNPPVDPASSIASIISAWKTVSASPNLCPYMDWPTPTMYDTMMGGTQQLMAGKMSPADFTKSIQAEWAKTHG
jgi:raffinose/stachyose/melibiose transport system substrate-binding protein